MRSTAYLRFFLQIFLVPNERFQRFFASMLVPVATTLMFPSTAAQG
jgi:hypothetical protein